MSSRHRGFVAEVGKGGSRSFDLFFLVLWLTIFFTAHPSMSSTRTIRTTSIFRKISYDAVRCNVFSSLTAVKHTVFFWLHFYVFEARLKPIAASST